MAKDKMKHRVHDCPSCEAKDAIQVSYGLTGEGSEMRFVTNILRCPKCQNHHIYDDNQKLIKYEQNGVH